MKNQQSNDLGVTRQKKAGQAIRYIFLEMGSTVVVPISKKI